MTSKLITTQSDIDYAKYCKCGRVLIGAREKESGICGVCQWLGVDT